MSVSGDATPGLTPCFNSLPLLRAARAGFAMLPQRLDTFMKNTGRYAALAAKGAAMGAANVIPGVSGGTIAFITGIYEELIDSIKSFDVKALKLALGFKVKEFAEHTNLSFLIPLFAGIGVSIFSLAKLLEYCFVNHETLTLAFFFGLIVASVYLVGKQINKWDAPALAMLVVGTGIAVGIAFLKPAEPNPNPIWIFVCGIVAISSMILPGLSGSYVLLIMGNYLLILGAIGDLNLRLLIPMAVGCAVGLVVFSHVLSYVFKHCRNGTIGLLTGFVFGSLAIIWPWKNQVYLKDVNGVEILKRGTEKIVIGYERFLPVIDGQFFVAMALMLVGAAAVIVIGKFDDQKSAKKAAAEEKPA
jgi:putative membrane protein